MSLWFYCSDHSRHNVMHLQEIVERIRTCQSQMYSNSEGLSLVRTLSYCLNAQYSACCNIYFICLGYRAFAHDTRPYLSLFTASCTKKMPQFSFAAQDDSLLPFACLKRAKQQHQVVTLLRYCSGLGPLCDIIKSASFVLPSNFTFLFLYLPLLLLRSSILVQSLRCRRPTLTLNALNLLIQKKRRKGRRRDVGVK